MPIKKLDVSALLPKLSPFWIFKSLSAPKQNIVRAAMQGLCLLPLTLCASPTVAAETSVIGVVKSPDNASQWTAISKRLQAAGVPYCTIDLAAVQSAADWSDRTVVFLPNVETISPTQAIALEEWMSRGGRVIASGAVGNLSQPGVRQLLRSLLGAYWGFDLSSPSQLKPLRLNTQEWVQQKGLSGTLRGGVVIPASLTSKPAAIWQAKDSPPAVVTTERSIVLGWQWGVDSAAPVEMDSAWLKAAVSRYVPVVGTANSPKICSGTKVAATPAPTPPVPATPTPTPQIAVAPTIKLPTVTPVTEPLDQIPAAIADVAPNSNSLPLSAIALQQELTNLIGRFESAQLAANARNRTNASSQRGNNITLAATSNVGIPTPAAQALAQAKAIAKTLPELLKQGNDSSARKQWLKAQQLLWQHYPKDSQIAQPEIRAMWLDRGSIVRAGSEQGLARIFDKLAAAGINTVFFETVNAGYPIYPSTVAPQQNPLVRGWDPLASAVKLAHQRGMELHAWVWTFAVGNQRHNTLVNLPANYPGPVLSAHPEWASYDNRGSIFPPGQGKPFLDPANPQARRYLLQLFDEIASRYRVDGLHLDYIRYPFQDPSANRTYGYGRAARQQFQRWTGVDPTRISPRQRDLWQKWTRFRTSLVDSFVAEVSQLRRQHPQLILSAAVFPLSESDRIQKLQQHWELWATRHDIDVIVPMTYAPDTYRFQRLTQPWLVSNKLNSTLILPGIRLLNLPIPVAVDQIQLARDLPVSGYSLFAVENFSNELQTLFQRTQGTNQDHRAPVPYRQPFQTALARYKVLQGEWQYGLTQIRIGGREPAFNSQVADVERALSKLAKEPSFRRLTAARAKLRAFKSQFYVWMRPYALKNPYQVKVWENRLATIERLLNYGETVVLRRAAPRVAEQPRY